MATEFVGDEEFSQAHGVPLRDVPAAKKAIEKAGEELAVHYNPADFQAAETTSKAKATTKVVREAKD